MSEIEREDVGACPSCEAIDRRVFVERASILAASALLSLGVPRRVLAMMRPIPVDAIARRGSTVSYPVPAADGAQIDKSNGVIITRWQGVVIAFNLACPHQRAPLRWNGQDAQFECPKHHSHYLPDGTYVSGRATRSMDRLAITKTASGVEVNLDQMFKEPDNPATWKAAEVTV
ncbi:MAG TPA: Rieske (2Fe-2S) protein [Gemmatimonadales bacterium]|jgi:nitrite reductase/ring-hydroxylating ferredoxin subunit